MPTIKFDPFVEDINRRLEKSRKESGTLSSAPATVAPPSTANNPSPRDPSIFGAFAYDINAADQALDQSINDMLQAQYQATEKRRTDAAKMAQIAALGNFLQTAFAPVGWIGQRGATSRVANPDSRQYITAFNEALKAQQDLGNIGINAAQMRLNIANRRADRAYNAWLQNDYAEKNLERQLRLIDARNAAILEQLGVKSDNNQKIQDRYDAREANKHGYRSSEANQRAANTKDINTAKADEQIRVATEKSKLPSRSSSGSGKKQSPTGGSTKKKKSPTA